MAQGYYKQVKKIVHHDEIKGVEEQGHYKTVKEYPNGGKDVEWVIDVPGVEAKPAYDEEVLEQVWTEYTQEELNAFEIKELKQYLTDTDYVIIKIEEAIIDNNTELASQLKTEYTDIIAQRKQARARIQELEE